MAKKLLVKDVLNIMDDSDPVNCIFYAYGVYYAQSLDDHLKTVADCKDGLRYDCANALVHRIRAGKWVVIDAEIVH